MTFPAIFHLKKQSFQYIAHAPPESEERGACERGGEVGMVLKGLCACRTCRGNPDWALRSVVYVSVHVLLPQAELCSLGCTDSLYATTFPHPRPVNI